MKDELHNVGKYGSKETCQDEINSKECASEVYLWLIAHEPINGYSYHILDEGFPEALYYKRDGLFIDATNKIIPDIPTIILVDNNDKSKFYCVLSGEDKYQETKGNAIERQSKNWEVFWGKICYNIDICPYVIFCCGPGFFSDEKTLDSYFESKFRQMMPYMREGKPHIFDIFGEKNSFKKEWNRLYLSFNRFSREEKKEILLNVAKQSVEYYKLLLKK